MRSLDAVTDRPKVIDRRHGEGPRRGLHGRARAEGRGAVRLPLGRAKRSRTTWPASSSCWPRPTPPWPIWGSAPSAPRPTVRNPRREPRQTDNLVAAYERALVAQGEKRAEPAGAGRRPDQGLRPGVVRQALSRALHRVRHRRAGHGVDGRRHGAARRAAGRPLVRLLPGGAAQRADLQPVQRALEGRLRGVAGGAAAGRARPLAPVGARHLGAGRRARAC